MLIREGSKVLHDPSGERSMFQEGVVRTIHFDMKQKKCFLSITVTDCDPLEDEFKKGTIMKICANAIHEVITY